MQPIPKIALALAIISNTLFPTALAAPTAQSLPLAEIGGNTVQERQCHFGGNTDQQQKRDNDCASFLQSRQMYAGSVDEGDVESRQISPHEGGTSGETRVNTIQVRQCCHTGKNAEERQHLEGPRGCTRCQPRQMYGALMNEGDVESRQILHVADNPVNEGDVSERRQILHPAHNSESTYE